MAVEGAAVAALVAAVDDVGVAVAERGPRRAQAVLIVTPQATFAANIPPSVSSVQVRLHGQVRLSYSSRD